MRDGGAHVAQVGGFGEDFNAVEQFPCGFLPAPDFKRQDDAASGLLFFHQFGLRVVGKAGMVNALDLRLPPQPFGDFFGIGTLLCDTQRQGFHAAEQHPGMKRCHRHAAGVHVNLHLLHQFLASDHHAALHPALPVYRLGGGVYRQVCAEFQRLLQNRGQEAVVHHQQRARLMGDVGQLFQIGHFVERVGRGFEEQHFGVRAHGGAPFVQIGLRNEADFDAEAGDVVVQQAHGGAEQAAAANQVVARAEEGQQGGVDGGHAGGGGHGRLAAFQNGDAFGEGSGGGIGGAAVGKAGLLAFEECCSVGCAVKHEAAGDKQCLVVFIVVGLFFRAPDGQGFGMEFSVHDPLPM